MSDEDWKVDHKFIVTPDGDEIAKNLLTNFTYWNYLQQGLGFARGYAPSIPKNRPPDYLLDYYLNVEFAIDMRIHELRRHGVMVQESFSLSPASVAGEKEK